MGNRRSVAEVIVHLFLPPSVSHWRRTLLSPAAKSASEIPAFSIDSLGHASPYVGHDSPQMVCAMEWRNAAMAERLTNAASLTYASIKKLPLPERGSKIYAD